MNKRMIIKMCINPHIIKTFLNLHCQFRKHEDYKVRNMVKCGLNIIINEQIKNITSKKFQESIDILSRK